MLVLKLKDVLHVDPNYDPTVPITPLEIACTSPDPLTLRYSCEQFRDFWAQERLAYDWERVSDKQSSKFYQVNGDVEYPLPDRAAERDAKRLRAGSPIRFDWSLGFVCRRHRVTKAIDLSRESVGQDCKASIRMQKLVGEDEVHVIYHYRHSHDTSPQAQSRMPLGRNNREWLMHRVKEGHRSEKIEEMAQPKNVLAVVKGQVSISPGLFIKQDDIRHAVYRHRLKGFQKDSDVLKSVNLWFYEITASGGKTLSLTQFHDGFVFGWSTAFQLHVISQNDGIYCMDSTHKTVKDIAPVDENNAIHNSVYLFTLLVKDKVVHRGIPVAFMVSKSESQYHIKAWLSWLKDKCGLRAKGFMVDCAPEESAAIEAVFGDAKIYYCDFHVARLWEQHMRRTNSAKRSKEMRPFLHAIRKAKDAEEQKAQWNDFKNTYKQATYLINYIEKNWLNKHGALERWAAFHREMNQEINTNNWIESWHATLKRCHMGNERNVRIDRLIEILQSTVDVDFQLLHFKISNGLQRLPMMRGDRKRREKANSLPFEQAQQMFTPMPSQGNYFHIVVKSFTNNSQEYTILVDIPRGLLLSCNCPDYKKHQRPCKHLYLADRVFEPLRVNFYIDQQLPCNHIAMVHNDNNGNNTNDTNYIEPNNCDHNMVTQVSNETLQMLRERFPLVVELLNVENMRKQEDTRRKKEEARREQFEATEDSFNNLLDRLRLEITKPKKCSLEELQAFKVNFQNLIFMARDLHSPKAGWCCQ